MKYLGKDFRLRVKIGGVFYTLDGETSTSGTMSREMPDITNKNSMPWRELMPSCGVLSMSMKVSGFTSSSLPVSSIRELFNAAFYGNEVQVQMASLNSDDIFGEGKTIITSLDRSGDKNAAETYNITLESVSPMSSGDAVLKVTTPVFTPYGGYVSPTAFITINDAIVGASIWYTLDGSTPTVGSRLYTAPFSLPSWFGFWSFASATSNITSVVLSGPIPGLPGSIAASTSSGSLSQPGGIYGAASSVAANYTGDITVMCNVSVSGTNSTDSGARWGLIRNLNSGTFDKFTVVVGYHSGVLSVFGYIGTTVLPITYVSSVTTVHVTLRLSDTAWTLFVNGTAVSNGTGVSYDGSSSDVGGYLPPSSGSGDTFFSIDNAGVFKGALSDARIAAIAGGSVPSFVYESSTTAKAFATKVGLIDSDVATAVYKASFLIAYGFSPLLVKDATTYSDLYSVPFVSGDMYSPPLYVAERDAVYMPRATGNIGKFTISSYSNLTGQSSTITARGIGRVGNVILAQWLVSFGTNPMARSTDYGDTWTAFTGPLATNSQAYGVGMCASSTRFVTVGTLANAGAPTFAQSSDSVTWTTASLPDSALLGQAYYVSAVNNIVVCVGTKNPSNNTLRVNVSNDGGISWSAAATLDGMSTASPIMLLNDKYYFYFAVSNGSYYYSADGSNWTYVPTPPTGSISAILGSVAADMWFNTTTGIRSYSPANGWSAVKSSISPSYMYSGNFP